MAQKIKFVTDSASDIPRSLREELDDLPQLRDLLQHFMICCWPRRRSLPMPS